MVNDKEDYDLSDTENIDDFAGDYIDEDLIDISNE